MVLRVRCESSGAVVADSRQIFDQFLMLYFRYPGNNFQRMLANPAVGSFESVQKEQQGSS